MTCEPDVEHYAYVHIENETDFEMKGDVFYDSGIIFTCDEDSFTIMPHSSWTATSRGLCLLTKIVAQRFNPVFCKKTNRWTHMVRSYKDDSFFGTAHSQFAITPHQDGKYFSYAIVPR